MDWKAYIRQIALSEALDKMSDKDREAYMLMCSKDEHKEVMDALASQGNKIDLLSKQNHFWRDFGANIAGNAAYDSALWLASRLLKLIK